jgi:translation initiation factor IF-2
VAVEVTGLSEAPPAGCEFIVVSSEKEARKLAEERLAGVKREHLRKSQSTDIQSFMTQHAERKEKKVLSVIIKADVKGSLEAIESMLLKIPSDKVRINIIASSVGVVSESDVEWAKAANALILGFHATVEPAAEDFAKKQNVKVLLHDVIYHLIDEVKEEMTKLLDKIRQENEVGSAQVKMVFKSSSHGAIAGCQIIDGLIKRSHLARVFRGKDKIWEGDIASLKRHQDDVKEVSKGFECGILLSNFKDVQAGDVIRSYEVTYLTQTL